ncbi:MAG: hypothetical protein CME19_09440 [Gemmatimonadetes bacterium]|nr:hypothetical protein [Gemmatimonadota bacterium]
MSFSPHPSGYIRHWLVTPVSESPYEGPPLPERQLRKFPHVDPEGPAPPERHFGQPGPTGEAWTFYDPGQNIFVEQSGFWHNLSVLNFYAATHLDAQQAGERKATFWSCGVGDLWLNGDLVVRNMGTRYMYPDPVEVALDLQEGTNVLQTRVQALGIRDSRFLIGLRLHEHADCTVAVPGSAALNGSFHDAISWIDSLRVDPDGQLSAHADPPADAIVSARDGKQTWTDGSQHPFPDNAWQADISVEVEGQFLVRKLERPASRPIAVTMSDSVDGARQAYIEGLAAKTGSGRGGIMNVLARHSLGQRGETDTAIIEDACNWIDDRPDCADFPLSALLRLYNGTTLTEDERARIKRTAVGFRYWHDEPGNDALCFDSENHSLLFHGCQMIAGDLFSDETFTNCDRTSAEQAQIGRERISAWLDRKTEEGFHEFLSSTYIPLTVGALLNVVDYARDDAMSSKAAALIDRLYTLIAEHAFDGVTVGPQGRVYRNVLTPDASGTQAMLAYTTPHAVEAWNDWISFLGASDGYTPPSDLESTMSAPVSKTYSEASVEISIEKTADYQLTSLQIPASWQKPKSEVDPPYDAKSLIPGRQGYQQHIWHATLGRDCHVFVNHPGATFDLSGSRPGFWYGNGHLPRTIQKGPIVAQIFDTPEDHPIPFTHAHWPSDVFGKSEIRDHWAFGRKGSGCIALWCSQPLMLMTEVLTDRELRAEGRCVAWMCLCGSGELSAFVEKCVSNKPTFDKGSKTLRSGSIILEF